MNGARGKGAAIADRAVIRHKLHRQAAPRQRHRQRFRRKKMSARASGCEQDRLIAHSVTRPMICDFGRRLVTAMRKPMPSASEMSEEPP